MSQPTPFPSGVYQPPAHNWIYAGGQQFDCVGDGVWDNTNSFQAAFNQAAIKGETVTIPSGTFLVTATLNMPPNIAIQGAGSDPGGITGTGTIIVAPIGVDIIKLPSSGIASGFHISDIRLKNGNRQIVSLVISSFVWIERVTFDGPGLYGVYIEGGIEEWYLNNCRFNGGVVGFKMAHVPVGSNDQFDKSVFRDCDFTGQSQNGVKLEVATSNNLRFEGCVFNFIQQHGFYGDGAFTGLVFANTNTESNGLSGPSVHTTGSITIGTNVLTVPVTTIANGDVVTVAGAGGFKDLNATVTAGGGTSNLTLSANAGATVANALVTNALYDDFTFANSVFSPLDVTFFGGTIGLNSQLRYSVKYDVGNSFRCYGLDTGFAPLYVLDQSNIIGSNVALRTVNAKNQTTGRQQFFAGPNSNLEYPYTWISSPPGNDIVIFQRDSLDNGTGSWGIVEFRRRDNTQIALFDSGGNFIANKTINATQQIWPATPALARQTATALFAGTGAPANGNGNNGDIYFRSDGGPLTTIYQKRAGAWVGIV